jgi:hypothetical protein
MVNFSQNRTPVITITSVSHGLAITVPTIVPTPAISTELIPNSTNIFRYGWSHYRPRLRETEFRIVIVLASVIGLAPIRPCLKDRLLELLYIHGQ